MNGNPSIIKLEDITKIYYQGKLELKILKNINLEIFKGDYLSIMGPSGSGKSTLMNILGCLDKATSGKYLFENRDISNFSDLQLSEIRSQKIGFIFQSFNLLHNYNIFENVVMPSIYNKNNPFTKAKERAKELIDLVGLSSRINHRPNELSGGQQQRVAIARALINNPHIVLADEPTGNLDSESTSEILKIFEKLNRENNVTIVIITHEAEISKITNRQIIIKDGIIHQ